MTQAAVVTTQLTSKRLKLHTIVAVCLMVVGVFLTTSYTPVPGDLPGIPVWYPLSFFVGLMWYIVTKIRIWWNHK